VEIYGNSFYYNNGAGDEYDSSHTQAYDDEEHYWNTTGKGNFWADWTEPDRDEDGIVDEPYAIDGGTGARDYTLSQNQRCLFQRYPLCYW